MADSEIERWSRWIDGPVHRGVIRMHFHRQIWRGVQEVVRDNHELPPSAYWAYHLEVYIDAQAVAVRRQADLGPRVASLGRLIREITEQPEVLTAGWWLEQWGPEDDDHRDFALERWTNDFGGEVVHHLDPAIPAADLDELVRAARSVRTYVNRTVAHAEDFERTQADPPVDISLDELDAAIDGIGELFKKYADLIRCVDVDLHVHMLPDWLAPFRHAWIRSD